MKSKVTLLSAHAHCRELLYTLWKTAHSGEQILSPEEVARRCITDAKLNKEVNESFERIINNAIPVAENVFFVFLLENISIELRDHIVRHRIGVRCGDTYELETVPDLPGSTFWAQGTRNVSVGDFAEKGRFRLPEAVVAAGQEAAFREAVMGSQKAYQTMLAAGVPIEEARGVLPLATYGRMTWGLSLTALKHICARRTCWIAQAVLWLPIVEGMARELSEKVDPIFAHISDPPCFRDGRWVGCNFHLENGERIKGTDPLAPCSLYVNKHKDETYEFEKKAEEHWTCDEKKSAAYGKMKEKFGKIWGRDPETGEQVSEVDENHGTTPEVC